MTPMSLQEANRIHELRAEGLGYKRIAKLLNRNVRTIKRRVSGAYRLKNNEKLRTNRRLRDGFGNVIRTVWTEDLVSLLKTLHDTGEEYPVMAARPEFVEAGLTYCALKNKASRLGLAKRLDPSGWADDQIEILKSLWGDGYSASLIAEQIGGKSRSSIIAKAKRLRLPARITTVAKTRKAYGPRGPYQKREKKNKRPDDSAFIHAHEDVARVSLFDLRRDQCRWPVGHVGKEGFGFCGDGVHAGSVYCAGHTLRAYRSVE